MRPRIVLQLIAAIVLTCAAAFAFSVWAFADNVRVRDAYIPPTLGTGTGAVYLKIRNDTNEADHLLRITSDAAKGAEMHTTLHADGVMKMRAVDCVVLPAHGEVIFAPGGLHVMLTGIDRELKVGDTIHLTLTLERAGEVAVDVPVKPRQLEAAAHMDMEGGAMSDSGMCD
jgi:copper(I)-binding protein